MKTKKVKWDSKVWRSQNQYFEFCDKYHVYGAEAIALKIKMDKEKAIPYPSIGNPSGVK